MKPVAAASEGVRRFLARHRIPTLNLAGILANEPRIDVFVDREEDAKGLLVKGPWFWYVHTEDDAFLEELCEEMGGEDRFYRFSGVWKPLAERIKTRFPLVWDAPCELYVLPEGGQVPPREGSRATSVRLEDAETIDAHYAYRHAGSLEKIRTCIQQRPSSAVYVDGRIACWLLVHEDGSLGIMYTLEEHRRKGYALDVSLDLIAKRLAEGRTPYLQIRDDNGMSPGLALKCGFARHGGCDWFGVMAGMPRELREGAETLRCLATGGKAELPGTERRGFYRFLMTLPPEPGTGLEVVADDREWLALASRRFGEGVLEAVLPGLKAHGWLLGERREGVLTAVAALLEGAHESGELRWFTGCDAGFLEKALHQAKALGLDTVFVQVTDDERSAFEQLGFREMRPGGQSASS